MSGIKKKVVAEPSLLPLPSSKPVGVQRSKQSTRSEPKHGKGWGAATPTVTRFSGTVDAATAQAVVYGLSGSITSLERLVSQPGARADLSTLLVTRLEKVARDLAQATTPGVTAALDEAHHSLLLEGVRNLETLTERMDADLGSVPARARPTIDRIRDMCAALVGSAQEPSLVLLDLSATTAGGLFDGPLPSKGPAIVYVDSEVPPRIVEMLAERVRQNGQALTVTDVASSSSSRIWSLGGRALTDDPAWAKGTDQVALSQTLSPDQLASQLAEQGDAGVKRCHLVHAGPISSQLLAALGALVEHLPKTAVEITDADGKILAKIDPETREITLAAPTNFTSELHQAYRGLLRRFLWGESVDRFKIQSAGELVKTKTGVELKSQSGDVGVIKDLLLEQVEHRVAMSLGARSPVDPVANQVRTILDAALAHAMYSTGHDHTELLSPLTWRSAVASITRFASIPSQAKLLKDVLARITEHSEHPEHPGFGNGNFRGVGLGANSAALMHLFNGQVSDSGLSSTLAQVPSVLGPQAAGVVVHGAGVEIIVAKALGEQARRLLASDQEGSFLAPELRSVLETVRGRGNSATDEQTAVMRLVDEAIRTAKLGQASFRVSVIPTDPTQGKAKTPTPDFVVEQKQVGQSRAVFLDAKSIDARHFDERHVTHIGTAVHQVLRHRFHLDQRQEGWPWIRLYRADLSASAKAGYFDLIRRGLAQGLAERPHDSAPADLKAIVLLAGDGAQEAYVVPLHGEPTRLQRPLFELQPERR